MRLELRLGRLADGDRPRADATHHHAFEHGLPTDRRVAPAPPPREALLGRGRRAAAAATRRWKRSTRPPVSISF